MPSTINGVGTNYVGKKNLQKNFGVCERCGYSGELLNYETREWFVIVFIPIIPLKRIQVLNYCSKCTAHRYMPLKEWEAAGDEAVTKAVKNFTSSPDDPESAIKLHATYDAFNKFEESKRMASEMANKFYNNAEVQMYLGSWHERHGRLKDADKCFDLALEADPEDKTARRAVAMGHIERGDPERARKLIDFMERPGPDQDVGVLYSLSIAYQKAEQHERALEIFRIICRDMPQLAKNDKTFRKAVLQSEKAAFTTASILPPAPFKWSRIAIPAIIILLVGGFLGLNEYFKSHQTLYLINRLPVTLEVSIPSTGEKLKLHNRGREEISVPEGKVKLVIQYPDKHKEETEIEIKNSFRERIFLNHVHVFTPKASAVLLWEENVYTVRKVDPNKLYPYRIYAGKEFYTFRDIDYVFEPYPASITTESSGDIIKYRISVVDDAPAQMAVRLYNENVGNEKVLDYMENFLTFDRKNTMLLQNYINLCSIEKDQERGLNFLKKYLKDKPVNIELHRAYQDISGNDLISTEYDMILEDSPENAAFLYLRGRVSKNIPEALKYYERSIENDPESPYPWFAKSYALASRGDLKNAVKASGKAVSLPGATENMKDFHYSLLLASGNAAEAEKQALAYFLKDKMDFEALEKLVNARLALGNTKGAKKAVNEYTGAIRKKYKTSPGNFVEQRLAYLFGQHKKQVELSKKSKSAYDRNYNRFLFDLLEGRIDQAEETLGKMRPEYITGMMYLSMWLAQKQHSDGKDDKYLKKAINYYRTGNSQKNTFLANLLEGRLSNVVKQVDDFELDPTEKAIFCAAASEIYSKKRKELLVRAEKLNFKKEFPYYHVKNYINNAGKDGDI